MEPAIGVDGLHGLILHVHIAHEDVASPVADLPGVGVDLGL